MRAIWIRFAFHMASSIGLCCYIWAHAHWSVAMALTILSIRMCMEDLIDDLDRYCDSELDKIESRISQIRKVCLVAFVFLLFGAGTAHSQTRVQFVANGAHGGTAPQICSQEASAVRSIVAEYRHPASWNWIIACDEASWQVLAKHLGLLNPRFEVFAATDRKNRITYVRGYTLLHPLRDYPTVPENVIVHELAHVELDSGDELRVEETAQQWIRERPKQVVASVESEAGR